MCQEYREMKGGTNTSKLVPHKYVCCEGNSILCGSPTTTCSNTFLIYFKSFSVFSSNSTAMLLCDQEEVKSIHCTGHKEGVSELFTSTDCPYTKPGSFVTSLSHYFEFYDVYILIAYSVIQSIY